MDSETSPLAPLYVLHVLLQFLLHSLATVCVINKDGLSGGATACMRNAVYTDWSGGGWQWGF